MAGAAALALPAWEHWHETPPAPPPALRLAFSPLDDVTIGGGAEHPFGMALAPDGRRAAFPGTRAGDAQIWVRDLTTGETSALPGTRGGLLPFWSPDGRHLGFFAQGRLKTVSLETGQASDLAEATTPRGGAWLPTGDIVFAPVTDGALQRRRAMSGAVETFTSLDTTSGERSHRFPIVLGDGRHLLFFVRAADSTRGGIWIAPIDSPERRVRLTGSTANAITAGDWILYASAEALLAQQLIGLGGRDATVTLTGRPVLVGTHVGQSPLNHLSAAVAGDLLVYGAPQPDLRELRWIDRLGAPQGSIATQVDAWDVRISPDGRAVAVTERDSQLGTLDVWVYDRGRPLPRRISTGIDVDDSPAWSPDGSRLAWVAARRAITVRGAQAQLPEQALRRFDAPVRVWDWVPDGQRIVIGQTDAATKDDLWIFPAAGAGEPVAYTRAPFNEVQADVSPDGKWIAYASDESGRMEIYVDSFPAPGHRVRVTNEGGTEPRWRRDAGMLFFRRGSEVHAAAIALNFMVPEAGSSTRVFDTAAELRAFDVAPDGQRFVVNVAAPDSKALPIRVVVHWPSLLGLPGTGDPK